MTVRAAVRRRFPGTYERIRHAYWTGRELVRWYAQRWRAEEEDAYDEAFWDFHDRGNWDGFAAAVLRHAGAGATLDVGCGDAKLLAALGRARPGLRLLGIDGSAAALRGAAQRGVPTRRVDLSRLGRDGAEALAGELGGFDLAISLETAEHFPAWHAGALLRLLAVAPRVLFSAARPGQGGTLHVNERPAEYWIARFARLGYGLDPADGALRRELAGLELPAWYRENVHLFVRRP